jgi:hypothetical protein
MSLSNFSIVDQEELISRNNIAYSFQDNNLHWSNELQLSSINGSSVNKSDIALKNNSKDKSSISLTQNSLANLNNRSTYWISNQSKNDISRSNMITLKEILNQLDDGISNNRLGENLEYYIKDIITLNKEWGRIEKTVYIKLINSLNGNYSFNNIYNDKSASSNGSQVYLRDVSNNIYNICELQNRSSSEVKNNINIDHSSINEKVDFSGADHSRGSRGIGYSCEKNSELFEYPYMIANFDSKDSVKPKIDQLKAILEAILNGSSLSSDIIQKMVKTYKVKI